MVIIRCFQDLYACTAYEKQKHGMGSYHLNWPRQRDVLNSVQGFSKAHFFFFSALWYLPWLIDVRGSQQFPRKSACKLQIPVKVGRDKELLMCQKELEILISKNSMQLQFHRSFECVLKQPMFLYPTCVIIQSCRCLGIAVNEWHESFFRENTIPLLLFKKVLLFKVA